MLVLVATNELQGTAADDYAWTVEGELVTPVGETCAEGDACGCTRGFPGLASAKATTTAMVVDRPGVTEGDLRDAVHDWLDRCGWVGLLEETAIDRSVAAGHDGCVDGAELDEIHNLVEAIIDEHVAAIIEVCRSFEAGTVIVRRGDEVTSRSFPSAA